MPRPAVIGPLIAAQRGHLFVWTPVFLGLGIGIFFALRFEPTPLHYGVIGAGTLLGACLVRAAGETFAPLCSALTLILLGLLLAGARAHMVDRPVLGFRYYGAIEGRVIEIDRSQSDKIRLMLDRVVLERTSPVRTPDRVRISLHGVQDFIDPVPGLRIMTTGHLSAPSPPSEPGGFDFQRYAWFDRLGAVGYTRNPVLAIAPPDRFEPLMMMNRFRRDLSSHVQRQLPGQVGAFAAAIVTGDRSGLSLQTIQQMRDTNLAHLLAISGLHIGLLTGFVFAAIRFAIASCPPLALRISGKKLGACVALVAAAIYLGLSGGSVSTQRAFIMVSVMLIAVMLDRRALTLRTVAIAATIVLVLSPESLLGPGFQMSFAATTALVWVFGGLRRFDHSRLPKWSRGVLALVISSAVAGFATAPIGAAHFNQASNYGLVANLLSVPLMGSVVIPAAVLAACLAPIGLSSIGLWIMGLGIRWILAVADAISQLGGAVRYVQQPDQVVLPLMILGALWWILWRGPLRFAGIVPIALSAWLWVTSERPNLLIADSGALIGVLTDEGRALNKIRGDGFAASSWLENDGGSGDREQAYARMAPFETGKAVRLALATVRLKQMMGRALTSSTWPCRNADVLVANHHVEVADTCVLISPDLLARSGAIAIWIGGDVARLVSVRDQVGVRLWNRTHWSAAPDKAPDRALDRLRRLLRDGVQRDIAAAEDQ